MDCITLGSWHSPSTNDEECVPSSRVLLQNFQLTSKGAIPKPVKGKIRDAVSTCSDLIARGFPVPNEEDLKPRNPNSAMTSFVASPTRSMDAEDDATDADAARSPPVVTDKPTTDLKPRRPKSGMDADGTVLARDAASASSIYFCEDLSGIHTASDGAAPAIIEPSDVLKTTLSRVTEDNPLVCYLGRRPISEQNANLLVDEYFKDEDLRVFEDNNDRTGFSEREFQTLVTDSSCTFPPFQDQMRQDIVAALPSRQDRRMVMAALERTRAGNDCIDEKTAVTTYMDRMREDGTFGDELELMVGAEILGRDIIVYQHVVPDLQPTSHYQAIKRSGKMPIMLIRSNIGDPGSVHYSNVYPSNVVAWKDEFQAAQHLTSYYQGGPCLALTLPLGASMCIQAHVFDRTRRGNCLFEALDFAEFAAWVALKFKGVSMEVEEGKDTVAWRSSFGTTLDALMIKDQQPSSEGEMTRKDPPGSHMIYA